MNASDLLAAARARQGIPSNYRLARVLGVTDKTVSRWNVGANAPDDDTAARLAEMAGLDVDFVLASMQALRCAPGSERARWERIAARLQAGAVAALLALFVGGGPDGGAMAATPGAQAHGAAVNLMSTVARALLRALGRALRGLAPPHAGGLPVLVS